MEKRDLKVEDATLLWKMSQMQDLFVAQRMWPSFVGAKDTTQSSYTDRGKSQSVEDEYQLPVLLWPEQKRYLADKGLPNYGEQTSPSEGQQSEISKKKDGEVARKRSGQKKRKREKEDGEGNDEANKSSSGEDKEAPIKKPRTGGILAGLTGFVSNAFSRVKRLVVPLKRMTNADVQSCIFAKCQDLGYFIGPGHVYGGDYNIYRGGDPSNSHSTATVRVVRRSTISGRDLLSFSRVQNQVAKSAVLAFVDPTGNDAKFLVANFQNVSERL